MAKIGLMWRPHETLRLHYVARVPGFSIVQGPWLEIGPKKFEVLDLETEEITRFRTEAEVLEFLKNG